MPRKSHTKLMFEFVQDYLSDEMERMFFDLDFNYYLIEYYPAMARQNPDMADCFVYYLSERGMDVSENLSDTEHKKLIHRQWNEFQSALKDGLY